MTVLDEIACRRQHQIAKGYDAAHDDEHAEGEIAKSYAAYALRAAGLTDIPYPWGTLPPSSGPREDLIDAAALIVAEVERLDRATSSLTSNNSPGES